VPGLQLGGRAEGRGLRQLRRFAPGGGHGRAAPADLPEGAQPELVVAGFVELLALAEAGLSTAEAEEVGERAKRTLLALTAGYDEDPGGVFRGLPLAGGPVLTALCSAPFRTVCSACLLPFRGEATVEARCAEGSPAVGADHLRRLLRCLSRRLQTEDSLAEQIAAAVHDLGGAGYAEARVRARRECDECGGGEVEAESRHSRGVRPSSGDR
jgi:GTP cyclohydrolase I